MAQTSARLLETPAFASSFSDGNLRATWCCIYVRIGRHDVSISDFWGEKGVGTTNVISSSCVSVASLKTVLRDSFLRYALAFERGGGGRGGLEQPRKQQRHQPQQQQQHKTRVPDQDDTSRLHNMLDICHSGSEPTIFTHNKSTSSCCTQKFDVRREKCFQISYLPLKLHSFHR